MLAGAFDGGEARLHVVLDPVAEGERVTDGGLDGAPRPSTAALFVGHAHGALEHGPRVAIRGIEEVKHLFGEVKRTPLVEVLRVVLADVPLAFALPRRDHLVVRLSCRSEVVGAVDALLVEVDVHLGHPFAVEGGPRLGFALGLPCQIPVHVEQVVVRPSAWPRLVVLPRVGVGVHPAGGRHVLKMHVPVASVGVHAWVQDHHGLVQQVCVARGQRLHGGHRRFGAHRLVAVNVVTQVHPCHAVASVNSLVHAQRVVRLEHAKAFHVGGGGHDQPQQRAPFRGGAVLGQLPMGTGLGHGFHEVHHVVVPREPFAQVVSGDVAKGGRLAPCRGEQGPCHACAQHLGKGAVEKKLCHASNIAQGRGNGKKFRIYVT